MYNSFKSSTSLRGPKIHRLFGGPSIKYFCNIPKNQNSNGTGMVFSPALAPYAKRYALHDSGAWLCAATLTLPGLPSILFVSVHDPPDKGPDVEALLSLISRSHPHCFLGQDFNAVSCPQLDLSLTDDPPRHWLRQATASPPPSLVDTFRTVNPTSLAFIRYKSSHPLLASPTLLTHALLRDSFIDSGNTTADHDSVCAILDLPSPACPRVPSERCSGASMKKER